MECYEEVPLEDWASHCFTHELQAEEDSKGCIRNDIDGRAGDIKVEGACIPKRNRLGAFVPEERAFVPEERRLMGVIFKSGVETQDLMTAQIKGPFKFVEEGIMNLLRSCLDSEKQELSCAAISGHIDHFESRTSEDVGWGCGWRNIQMLSSHLLVQDWGAKEVLFGGVGFVPDIPSLQKWLEIAWARGFDKAGAEWYHWKIYGSKEWIGTSECAALFRSFGLRARIVDFSSAGSKSEKNGQSSLKRWLQQCSPRSIQAQKTELLEMAVNAPIHHNIECDLCGVYPIRGTRFRSMKRNNYDICSSCLYSSSESPEDYEKLETPSNTNAGFKGKAVASDEDVNHESLVNWVWDYFTNGMKDVSSRADMDHLWGRIITSGRTPLYFQHQGHSRTIVGMQRRRKYNSAKEEVFLLVLDPAIKTEELTQALRGKARWQRFVKRGVHTLKKRSYQVCYIEPGIAQGEELEQMKVLSSEQHSY